MDDFYLKFLQALNVEKVRYLVIDGFAVNFHGYNRTTADLDIWISNDKANLDALVKAIDTIGFEFSEIARAELEADRILTLTDENSVIELITRINISQETSFDKAFAKRKEVVVDSVKISSISLEDLKKEKAKSKRYKDLDDLSKLEEAEAYYKRLKEK